MLSRPTPKLLGSSHNLATESPDDTIADIPPTPVATTDPGPPATQLGSPHNLATQASPIITNALPMATAHIAALHFHTMDPHRLALDQETCPQVTAHKNGNHPPSIVVQEHLFVPDVKIWCETSTGTPRPIIPESWRPFIFNIFHNPSHPGQKATAQLISERYYWPDLRPEVARWVKECKDCQAGKRGETIKPPCKPGPVTQDRFSDLQLNVVGPLPISEGQRYLFTIFDRTTRWISAIPMPEASAQNCVNAFIRGWIKDFGVPKTAKSDNGNTFTSNLWKNFHKSLGVVVSFSPPYRPQAMGGVERQHRSIKTSIKAALHRMGDEHGERWMEALPWTLLGRHTAYQPDLKASAADLVFGGPLRLPGDLLVQSDTLPVADLLDGIRQKLARPAVPPSHHQNLPVTLPKDTSTATHVFVLDGKPSPLGPPYKGPFQIVERLGDSCIKIHVGKTAQGEDKFEVQHWSKCKPAFGSHPNATRPNRGRKAGTPADTPAGTPASTPVTPAANHTPMPPTSRVLLQRKPVNYAE